MYLLGGVFVIFVIGCLKKILCCWTKESHDFWADHFPCCCKKCQNPESEDGNKGNKRPANSMLSNLSANGDSEQQSLVNPNVKKQDDGKSVNLAVKQESAEGPIGCSDDLTVSYKREDERAQMGQYPSNTDQFIQDGNDRPAARTEIPEQNVLMNPNGNSIQQTNGRSHKGVKKVMRRRSSTSSLPDVSEDAPLSGDLPEWCKHDNTMVKCEDILDISRHIGKEVARIGVILGLTTGEVETIEHDHKFDLSRQNLVVLQEWKGQKGVHATKGVLAHALHKIGRGELAKKYLWPEQEWKQS
ncbi:uncharacterized protein [Antedon mediterranea]|uniref:uncharacterized protein n=1 Tax=Antedon mediterranea TaxID=105859 RepID=UPI003AF9F717